MEMELDGGDSDTGLLPPGIEQSETSPARTNPNANRPSTVESNRVPAEGATPSQESIWSMLEHSSKQNEVASEAIVQPPAVARIHNPVRHNSLQLCVKLCPCLCRFDQRFKYLPLQYPS